MKLWCVFDLATKKRLIESLEAESMAGDFWSDNRKAQAQMQQLNALRDEVTTWESIDEQLNDLHGLAGLLEEEPDEGLQAEVARSLAEIEYGKGYRCSHGGDTSCIACAGRCYWPPFHFSGWRYSDSWLASHLTSMPSRRLKPARRST